MEPLSGYLVVDLTRAQQGPHATAMLSDMGAEVIKVEPRTGDLARSLGPDGKPTRAPEAWREAYHLINNRNKKGITLDFTKPRGREVLLRLAAKADVFVHNFRPGVDERLCIDYTAVSAVNPRIVYASASAFGRRGPKGTKPGFDILAQAAGGIMSPTGYPGGPPTPVGAAVADQTGSILLAHGIVLALLARERTGIGQEVDVSLLGGQVMLQSWELTAYLIGKKNPPKAGRYANPWSQTFYGIFPCKDGYIALAGVTDDRWPVFCRALGIQHLQEDPRFVTNAARITNKEALFALVDPVLTQKPAREWLDTLEALDLFVAPVNTYADVAQDPQVLANEYIVGMDHPRLGRIQLTGIPIKLSKTPGSIKGPGPELGQHTDEVLARFGYTPEEIAALRSEKVL